MPRLIAALALLLLAGGALSLAGEPRAKEPLDALGRPLPWGKVVRERKVGLSMPRTQLLYGQPLEVELRSFNPTRKAPLLRFQRRWVPLYEVRLSTARGEAVPVKLNVLSGGYGMDGNEELLRLTPRGKCALGRYLKPGSYRLKITFDLKRSPGDPCAWVGKIETNALEIVVYEKPPADPAVLVPEKLRKRAAPLIARLGAVEAGKRDAAFKALSKLNCPELLPLLEKACDSKSADISGRARRLLWPTLDPLVKRTQGVSRAGQPARHAIGPIMARFRAPTWDLLKAKLKPALVKDLRVLAALYGPVDAYRDLSKISEADAKRLARRLADPDPAVRARAVRSLSRTRNPIILRALAARLGDPHCYILSGMEGGPYSTYPIAREAVRVLEWQGRAAAGPVVELCRAATKKKNRLVLYRGLPLLGRLGPDPRSLKFLGEVLESGEHSDRCSAVEALEGLGPVAAPLLLKAAKSSKQSPGIRREAIEALAKCGKGKEVEGFILRTLAHKDDGLVQASAEAARGLKLVKALPELKRIALDEKIDQNARYEALAAVARLAPREEAGEFLLKLLDSKCHDGVRGKAGLKLAELDYRPAVPVLLKALEHGDWYLGATADHALRGFANKPEGVGFNARATDAEARRREAEKWRRHFKEKGE